MDLQEKIGQMIMTGFKGKYPTDPEVQKRQSEIQNGFIGGLIAFTYNIDSSEQLTKLNQSLQSASPKNHPILIAVDQEGGYVQRLKSSNGFTDYLSAKKIAATFSPEEAEITYKNLAKELAQNGFNLNFAPVVDLDGRCPVIGQIERAYHKDPEIVSQYARSFVKAHRQEGILTSLKHFPGHGFATGDTHKGFVDITETFENQELEPFYKLIDQGYSDMIMVGHQTHRGIDPNYPATLSKKFIIPLLRERGYDGVVVSDDLHMGAILQFYSFEETIVNAINAGIDILVFSNNPAAGGEYANRQGTYDLTQIHATILKSIQKGRLSEHRIHQSYDRIMKLKSRL